MAVKDVRPRGHGGTPNRLVSTVVGTQRGSAGSGSGTTSDVEDALRVLRENAGGLEGPIIPNELLRRDVIYAESND